MGEATIIEDVVVHSVIDGTEISNWKTNELLVPRNEEMKLRKKDYKTTMASIDSIELVKQRILNEYNKELEVLKPMITEPKGLSDDSPNPQEDSRVKKLLQAAEECCDIPDDIRDLVVKLLMSNKQAFYKEGDVLPKSVVEDHYIFLVNENKSVHQNIIPLSFSQREILMAKVSTLVNMGVITRCVDHSPFNSPVFLVAKQAANQYRMVNCFVKLNSETARLSRHPMMRADEATSQLSGMKCFSTLDFSDGFYQIGIHPPHQERTAFSADGNQWIYKRMAQGLAGAPATFNHVVNVVLGPYREIRVEDQLVSLLNPFVDDILIASIDHKWHLVHLSAVLEAMKAANMVLSAKKTCLYRRAVNYLGKLIDKNGILPSKADVSRIYYWPKPSTRKEMRSFLGLVNFVSDFVENEKDLTACLRRLKTGKHNRLEWDEEANKSFLKIKEKIKTCSKLAFPIYNRPDCQFILATDASKNAVAAVLKQVQLDGSIKTVSFASRTMSDVEKMYSMPHKEMLGCVFGLKKFGSHIKGQALKVQLDHMALVKSFIRGGADDPKVQRWLIVMQAFMPGIVEHISSKDNPADILTRNPFINELEWQTMDDEEKTIFEDYYSNGARVPKTWDPEYRQRIRPSKKRSRVLSLATAPEVTVPIKDALGAKEEDNIEDAMKIAQADDPWCVKMITYISDPIKSTGTDPEVIQEAPQYIVQGGRLFKISRFKPRLYVPQMMREKVISICHESKFAGHGGILATEARVNQDFFWKGSLRDITKFVKKCTSCQMNKRGVPQKVPTGKVGLQEGTPIPFHTLNLDIKGPLPRTNKGNIYIISFFDPATHWVEAYPYKNKDAKSVMDALSSVIMRHGFPKRIVSDRDSAFLGGALQSLVETMGIAYEANPSESQWMSGSVERFHGSIGTILSHYVQERNEDWDDYLPYALFAYRTAYQARIKNTPFQLLYGREPLSEANVKFQAETIKDKDSRGACQRIEQAMLIGDRLGDLRKFPDLEKITPGMKIRVKRTDGRKDIRLPRWLGPYKVISVEGQNVFYEGPNGRANSAHRSHVKPEISSS